MHRKLLLMAFEKARKELIDRGDSTPSINKCAKELSTIVSEDFAYGSRILRILYKRANESEKDNFSIPRIEVVQALAKYLEYDNYEEFVLMNKGREQKRIDDGGVLLISPTDGTAQEKGRETVIGLKKNNKFIKGIAFAGIFIIAITFSIYLFVDRQKWMVWDGSHYVESSFDPQKLKEGNLKTYKKERITDFKKLLPTCETKFFNDDGSVRVWYGKNKDGTLQYFTSFGLHPETGKTLKPISKYMIGKYICP